MKLTHFVAIAAASAIFLGSSAHAEDKPFTGPYVAGEVSVTDDDFAGTQEGSWGVEAGYDHDIGSAVIGGRVNYGRLFDDDDMGFSDVSVLARIGMKPARNVLVYGLGGYSHLDFDAGTSDGFKLGLGAEMALGKGLTARLETRYGNYEDGLDLYQTAVGIGYRF